jgi:hypothetical protein
MLDKDTMYQFYKQIPIVRGETLIYWMLCLKNVEGLASNQKKNMRLSSN